MLAIDILEWPGMNVAFLASFFGAIALSLAVIPFGKRRPVGKPLSWGEAMIGSVYAFGVMFLAFGIVPAPVDRPRRQEPRAGARTRSSTAPAAS